MNAHEPPTSVQVWLRADPGPELAVVHLSAQDIDNLMALMDHAQRSFEKIQGFEHIEIHEPYARVDLFDRRTVAVGRVPANARDFFHVELDEPGPARRSTLAFGTPAAGQRLEVMDGPLLDVMPASVRWKAHMMARKTLFTAKVTKSTLLRARFALSPDDELRERFEALLEYTQTGALHLMEQGLRVPGDVRPSIPLNAIVRPTDLAGLLADKPRHFRERAQALLADLRETGAPGKTRNR